MTSFFRDRVEGEEQRATALELFFDLVFVFAITQLSHLLVEHLDLEGAAQTVFLLLVVWWAWIYTTWMTNWFDPDTIAVRGDPDPRRAGKPPHGDSDSRRLRRTGGDVRRELRRAPDRAECVRGLRKPSGERAPRELRADPRWSVARRRTVGGRSVPPEEMPASLYGCIALVADYGGPYAGYWVPCLGRVGTEAWRIQASHFAERFQLFVIIALGESIVVTGLTASELDLDAATVGAIAVAFLGSAALWWLYFNYVARIARCA